MSIAAKQILIKDFEKEIGRILTVDQTDAAIRILADKLGVFHVEVTPQDELGNSTDLLDAFLDAKQIEGRSPKTLQHYKYVITKMLTEIRVPVSSITVYHLRSYLMGMRKRGIADKTIESTRSVMSSFFGWLHREGILADDPCTNLNPIKCAKKVRQPFSEVDIERLKEGCTIPRDRAIISLLLATGCRISEVCELNRDQIDFQNLECTVHGKGDKERTVFLDPVTAMLLRRYLADRHDNNPALFTGKGSERMTPGGIRFRLKTIAKAVGVDNVHPHRFRRTLATGLIDRGMPIQEVAAILGHDKIDTTLRYVYIDKTNTKNAYKKYA